MRLMSVEEPAFPGATFTSVVSMSVQPSPLKPQFPGWIGERRSVAGLGRAAWCSSSWGRTRLQIAGDRISDRHRGFKFDIDLRDGGDERAVGDEVIPSGKDVRALDEGGLHWR